MKIVGLVSGGKDSCFNLMNCIANGHELVAIANLMPANKLKDRDVDSYMFQTVGYDALDLYSECFGIPFFRRALHGKSVELGTSYSINKDDEVEDLYELLKQVQEQIPGIQGVASGAIFSGYQRVRIENVCERLGLVPLAYLWQRDQEELLQEMIDHDVDAVLIKVAGEGLNSSHLGKSIATMQPILQRLSSRYGTHVCGEGGEYETLTLSCPLFQKQLVIKKAETCIENEDDPSSVSFFHFQDLEVAPYQPPHHNWIERLKSVIQEKSPFLPEHRKRQLKQYLKLKSNDTSDFGFSSLQLSDDTPRETCPALYHRHGYFSVSAISIPNSGLSFAEETKAVLDKIQGILSQIEVSIDQASMLHVFVRNISDFAALNAVYGSYFGRNPPTRVTVQAPLKNCQIQVDAYGYRGIPDSPTLQHLHVQSISYWAPANIGPYSQAVQVLDHLYLSGQIGLIPETMLLPLESDPNASFEDRLFDRFLAEAAYSFRSVCNVSSVMGSNLEEYTLGVVVYITNEAYLHVVKQFSFYREVLDSLPFLVVVMPGLPRNALIEWEVMAGSPKGLSAVQTKLELHRQELTDSDHNDLELEDIAELDVLSYTSDTLWARRYGRFSFGLAYGLSTSSHPLMNLAEIESDLDALLKRIKTDVVFKSDHALGQSTWIGIYSFRIFHHYIIDSTLVLSSFCKVLKRHWNVCPPTVSSVPVHGLEKNRLFAVTFKSSLTEMP